MVPGVEPRTRARGSMDTGRLALLLAVIASVVIHALPFVLLAANLLWAFRSSSDELLADHPTIIPIEFGFEEEQQAPSGTPPPGQPPQPATTTELGDVPAPQADALDAGVDAPADAPVDAPVDAFVDAADKETEPDAESDATVADAELDAPEDSPDDATGALDAGALHEEASAEAEVLDAGVEPDAGSGIADLDAAIARAELDAADVGVSPHPVAAGSSAGPGVPDRGLGSDAGASPATDPIHDPVRLSGGVRSVAPKDPNVSLLIDTERLRGHRFAVQFAPTLTRLYQWRSFFEGTGLDPVMDTDRILLAGPQFRDSSRVVAVLQHNVAPAKVRAAVSAVVQRSGDKGQWLRTPVPAARGFADRAERYFVMPSNKLLLVVPSDGLDQALRVPPTAKLSRTKTDAFILYMRNPANALRGLPIKIPASIEWMRMSVALASDGGIDIRVDAKDADSSRAQRHASDLTKSVNDALVIRVLFLGQKRLMAPVTFRAEGDHIRTEAHVREDELKTMLSAIAAAVEQANPVPAPSASHR